MIYFVEIYGYNNTLLEIIMVKADTADEAKKKAAKIYAQKFEYYVVPKEEAQYDSDKNNVDIKEE